MTLNKNTAVENGEGSLDKGATRYEYVQGYYDGCTWCDHAVIPEPQSRNTQLPNTQPPMQGGIDWITVCNNLEAAFDERILETIIGVGSAYLFGIAIPKVVTPVKQGSPRP